ncbi:hypothetical protein D9M70_342620 [compost metagenome]
MDLLKEVRHVSRQLQDQAFAASRCRGAPSYLDTLRAMLGERLRHDDARVSVVGYASAAELGVAVEPLAMACHDAIGPDMDYPLRVLFWAAHRRMQGLRSWSAHTDRAQAR